MNTLVFLGGLILLVIGANTLVRGASRLAMSFGISPLVVGLTVVAFGTSAPEVAVSVGAVLDGKTDIGVGGVVGSNIFNVLFILGISALIAPLVVNIQLIRQEVPIMLGASLLLLALSLDGRLSVLEGGFLLVLLVAYTVFLIVQSRRETQAAQDEYAAEIRPARAGDWDSHWAAQIGLIAAGLVALVFGSEYLVQASVHFAKAMGVSDVVIGLTIVAAGTSMPEVATSITAAIKGERDIAVGNVVGSNTLNILGCLGLSGLVSGDAGLTLAPSLLTFDIWVMLAFGIVGYLLKKTEIPAAPMVLTLILGPLLERALRQSLEMSVGDPWIFLERPLSATLIVLAVLVLSSSALQIFRRVRVDSEV